MDFILLRGLKCAPVMGENGDLITYGESFSPSRLVYRSINQDFIECGVLR